MAADLYLYAFPNTDEYRDLLDRYAVLRDADFEVSITQEHNDEYRAVSDRLFPDTDRAWVGSVSWAKAGDAGDTDRWVPAPVARISDLVEETTQVLALGLAKEITVRSTCPTGPTTGTGRDRAPARSSGSWPRISVT